MFLFTDVHVANESFLELINNMLTSGMIPALYEDAEKDGLIGNIREQVNYSSSHVHLAAWNLADALLGQCRSTPLCVRHLYRLALHLHS